MGSAIQRSEIVGKRIARLLRTEYEVSKQELIVPGISTGEFLFFRAFVEFTDKRIMRLGSNRRYGPPEWDSPDRYGGGLFDLALDCPRKSCAGESIDAALVCARSEDVYFHLSSGLYLWYDAEINQMVVYLEDESWFTEDGAASAIEMLDYWTNEPTDFGGMSSVKRDS
jgi:hypothetical protein